MSTLDTPTSSQTQISYRPVGLRYGMIAALIIVALGLVFQMTGVSDPTKQYSAGNIISNLLTWGVMIGAIVMAVRQHRDEELNGFITFGRSFGLGMLVVLVMAVISAVWIYVYMSYINPGMMEEIMEAAMEKAMEERGVTEEQLEASSGVMNFFMSPLFMTIAGFFMSLFIGLVISLIVSMIMKKEPQTEIM